MNWLKQHAKTYRKADWIFLTVFLVVLLFYYEVIPFGFGENPVSITPYQLLFLPLIVLMIYRMIRKERFAIHLVLLFFTGIFTIVMVNNGVTNSIAHSTDTLRICSWNTAYFFQEKNRDQGFKVLKETRCDVVFLQEIWDAPSYASELITLEKKYFPGHDIYYADEFVILTPQGTASEIYNSSTNSYFSLNLFHKGKTLSLVNVHLWNPIVDRPYLNEKNEILYRNRTVERERQYKDLTTFLKDRASKTSPLVIMGDFNTLPQQKSIRSITKIGSKESQLTAVGVPWWSDRATYPSNYRLAQIDYSFVSKSLSKSVTKSLTCYPDITDHCLLILDLLL